MNFECSTGKTLVLHRNEVAVYHADQDLLTHDAAVEPEDIRSSPARLEYILVCRMLSLISKSSSQSNSQVFWPSYTKIP